MVSAVLVAGCAAVIVLRGDANVILLSMMLTYLIQLQSSVKYSMGNFGEVERKMVSTQRLYDLSGIPQEKSA